MQSAGINPMARKSSNSQVPTFICDFGLKWDVNFVHRFCRFVTGLMQIALTIHATWSSTATAPLLAQTYSALIASASCLALSNIRLSSFSLPLYALCTCRSNSACASSAAILSISSTSAALGSTGVAPVFATNCFQMSSAMTSFKFILTAVSPSLASGAGVLPSVDDAMCCHGSEPLFLGAFVVASACSDEVFVVVRVVESAAAVDDWL